MVQLVVRRKLAVLLMLFLALLAPLPAAALPFAEPVTGLVSRLTVWFTVLWGQIGCSADPGGRCHGTTGDQPPAPADQIDIGCSMDPGGLCRE